MSPSHSDLFSSRSQGAEAIAEGVRYRTWTHHPTVDALIVDQEKNILRALELKPCGESYFEGIDSLGRAGDLYRFRLGKQDHWPDPASRCQPFGVHGASLVIDPRHFPWADHDWSCPPFRELVIYELHVGTFTPAGTFRGVIEQLDYLAALGITAIQLMPIADFPGDRNWGYDGVMLYAPSRAYGLPDDLRALVDAAHAHGLAVILDVVYNHFGPDGNYVGHYHKDYFDPERTTPWGAAFNYTRDPVRDFFTENASYWMREFHIDGFRLDATHTMVDPSDRHILAEIAKRIHDLGGFIIAEDERNEPNLLLPAERGGLELDGCWADDFHHVVRVMLTAEREGYYANFEGRPRELIETIEHGWLYRGQPQPTDGKPRGGDASALAPEQFIYCISNHDQVGNRAFGDRLGHIVDPAEYRAASALLCLVPHTPLLFMGQEWSASTPFRFFTNHEKELGEKITDGRRHEFRNFAAFSDPNCRKEIPDPQEESTFLNSKLRWEELELTEHSAILQLYRACLELRRTLPLHPNGSGSNWRVRELADGIIAIVFGSPANPNCALLVDLVGGHAKPQLEDGLSGLRPILSTNETRFGGEEAEPFSIPTTLVLGSAR